MFEPIIRIEILFPFSGYGPNLPTIDLFSLSVLLPHFRPRDVPQRFILLSILKLIIHTHANILEFESNDSLEYHHVVCNGATKRTS